MSVAEADVETAIKSFLARVERTQSIEADLALFDDGLELDSLETATLSAHLEDEFGIDPFSGETLPRTVGDIFSFYRER